jgi:hypothetical protein
MDPIKALKAAKAAAQTLMETERSLRAQHAALLAERKDVTAAHAAESECVANLGHLVDGRAARWAQQHGVSMVRQLGGHRELSGSPGSTVERDVPPQLPSWGQLGTPLAFEDLCGLAPALVKARLTDVVHASGARFGLPAAERTAKLEELDRQIAEVETTHSHLVADAGGVGITLPLLDAVQARREAEAREQGRARDLADERSRGVYAVEA